MNHPVWRGQQNTMGHLFLWVDTVSARWSISVKLCDIASDTDGSHVCALCQPALHLSLFTNPKTSASDLGYRCLPRLAFPPR
jgi:hypothetical protein